MIVGIFFVLAGILLLIFPQLLAFFVAFMFILWGVSMMYMGLYYRRVSHKFNDPVIDFMFRL